MTAFRLDAEKGEGLILFTESVPSAPGSGRDCQIVAIKEGSMSPLSLSLTVYGDIRNLPKGTTDKSLRLFPGDTMLFGVWSGNFEVIVPVFVDFEKFEVRPRSYSGIFEIEAYKRPHQEGAVVKLFPAKSPDSIANRVVLTKDVHIEFISAYAEVLFDRQGDGAYIGLRSTPWLKVKVGGIEGWVRDEEDLNALGLPSAG